MKFIRKKVLSRSFIKSISNHFATGTHAAQPVIFRRAQHEFLAETNLLSSAEQAGLRPQHGCRMGVCNKCSCTKVSGVTQNLLTGEIEDQPNRPLNYA